MGQVIRVSLPTYDALTDNNPDHFALYSDENWILIKEKNRGLISATSNGQFISHGLGYVPTVFAFWQDGNIWKEVTGQFYDYITSSLYPSIFVTDTEVFFYGNGSILTNFKYFICYDQQV